ncbi:sporulation protein [Niallia sp. 01092]|uniref:sporulation protein n=1 Tax=unclassified Niallia TaxID=2837522 RepID=UPI003FD3E3E7
MSFFQKALASVGIGAAKVDTVLHQQVLSPGSMVNGEIIIKGGNVQQNIDKIYLRVNATFEREADDKKYTDTAVVDSFLAAKQLTIGVNEQKNIPFSFVLSPYTPLTMGKTKVWISTGLDIKNAIDPTDNDYLEVKANHLLSSLLNTVSELGFQLREVGCKAASFHERKQLPFLQELEYKPVTSPFYGRLDEIELLLLSIQENRLEILVQIDKKARGLGGLFAEAFDMDERFVRVTITDEEIPVLKQKLYAIMDQHA